MKNFLTLFSILFFLSFSIKSQAQISLKSFSSTSGIYTEITGGTVVASATGTSGAASLDDVNYSAQPLPFNFNFGGVIYNSYNINSNGYITFGATLPAGGFPYSPISNTAAYEGAISVVGRDIQGCFATSADRTSGSPTLTNVANFAGVDTGRVITGTGIPSLTTIVSFNIGAGTIELSANATSTGVAGTVTIASGEISSTTTGSVGSQVHIIQFKNFRKFAGVTDNFNMQIKLYETTNIIECSYGFFQSNTTNAIPQVGLRGTTNADFNNRTTTTNWSNTTAGGSNTSTCALTNTVFPSSGLIFRWSAPLTNDVGPTAVLSPVNGGGAGNITPMATITNFGSANQTTPFNITCTINPGGYSNTVSDTISSGTSKNVTFANVALTAGVQYTVTVYTSLAGDQNQSNDTLIRVVTLIDANYGNDSGYFFANNLATNQPSFPKYVWKDTTGSISLLQNGATSPGSVLVGSVDDGFFVLSLKDILMDLGQDTTDKHLKYNGVCYDSIFPGSNGIIGFTQAFGTYSLTDFNIDGAQVAKNALLPLWHDFDLGTLTFNIENRLSYKVKGNQLIITYDKVAAFAPENNWASFQVVIEIVSGCGGDNSNFRYTYADTTTGQTSGEFVNDYLAQYPAVSGATTTFRNYIVGYSQNGAPIPYGGFVSSGNPFPASPVTQVNLKRPIYNLSTNLGLTVEFGPNQNNLNLHGGFIVSLAISLQGPQSNTNHRVRDTVEIIIHDGVSAPYNVIQKYSVLMDSAYNSPGNYPYGTANLEFSQLKKNYPYYIEIKNRNSLESWSQIVSTSGDTLKYDFTTSLGQTYGGNSVLVNGAASFYSGDIESPASDNIQDGCIDQTDVIAVYNDAVNFVQGPYVLSDLNYDGITDLTDIILVSTNSTAFVCTVRPPGAAIISHTPVERNNYNYVRNDKITILPDPYAQDKNTQPLK